MRITLTLICGLFAAGAIAADEPLPAAAARVAASTAAPTASVKRPKSSEPQAQGDAKTLSGISILGNQEAPKALVIVPWKSSQLGDPQGISKELDDGRQPVDKEVFMRELSYYEIRTGSK